MTKCLQFGALFKMCFVRENQIKGAWKRINREWKSENVTERRRKFRTGGGPTSPTELPYNTRVRYFTPKAKQTRNIY